MKLLNKIIMIIGLTTLLLIVILVIFLRLIVTREMEKIDYAQVEDTLARVSRGIEYRIEMLDHLSIDWALWDATYDFVQYRNSSYIESNLPEGTLAQLNVNIFFLVGVNGSIVYNNSYYSENMRDSSLNLNEYYFYGWNFFENSSRPQNRSIIMVDNIPLLLVISPVLRGDGSGPETGYLLMGRFLADSELEAVSDFVGYPFEIMPFNAPDLPPDFIEAKEYLSEKNVSFIREGSQDYEAYLLVLDLYNQPGLIAKVFVPRVAYNQGLIMSYYLWIAVVISCLLIMLIIIFIFKFNILNRMKLIYSSIQYIKETDDLSYVIKISGKDEVASLSANLNEMIIKLRNSRDLLVEKSEQLKDANEELKILDEMKDNFISGISHELKTPLAAIRTYAQLLEENAIGKTSKEQKQSLRIIIDSSDQLKRLINEFLEISRLESRTTKFKFEMIMFGKLLKDTIKVFTPKLNDLKAKITVTGDKNVSLNIDKDHVGEVFSNLIDNSIKYRDEKRQLVIDINIKQMAEYVEIRFSDNGIGIREEEQKFLFTKFYQSNQGFTKPVDSGVGLGLSIVKEIINSHKGSIHMESEFGKGTTTIITLPINIFGLKQASKAR